MFYGARLSRPLHPLARHARRCQSTRSRQSPKRGERVLMRNGRDHENLHHFAAHHREYFFHINISFIDWKLNFTHSLDETRRIEATVLVRNRIENAADTLTASERKLAAAILSDYPYAGLASIQELAKRAEVSPPSISRFVTKIGLGGYQEFQRDLIAEIKEGQRSPPEIHRGDRSVDGGYLRDFADRASAQMAIASEAITEAQFARVCALLSDSRRDVYLVGGRISDTIARHLSFHLRQSRQGVYHLPENTEVWPEYLLRMKQGDVLFMVDFRRYQTSLERLSDKASKELRARVVLMTDKWLSPIAKHATEVMPVPIESGTLWDTYTPALAVIEAIATKIAEDNFDQTRARIQAWDSFRLTNEDHSQ
ncbi:MurR/RpiR family transcriptional regulator [Roseovarius atlanticus]|uniref:MurR/RpiR family transcriptional regulator n=2 Tax=Roseovarius atlanticus TaxID=1641875 RepID=UPI0028F6D1C4|nr:MurR/RpiR family transcriptional regulator [Roseovarius atlanticus]